MFRTQDVEILHTDQLITPQLKSDTMKNNVPNILKKK